MKTIILIGYMGCGKTSVGKRLATNLGYEFLDTDKMIVDREKMSINEIFATKGEEYFRDLETTLIKEMLEANQGSVILSTGGGMPIREQNAQLMKELGEVVYLKAQPETIYERVKYDSSRPLLKCDDPLAKIKTMIAERGPKYEACATKIVDVDNKSFEEIIKEIV